MLGTAKGLSERHVVGLQGTMLLPLSHPTWHLGHSVTWGTRGQPGHLSPRKQGTTALRQRDERHCHAHVPHLRGKVLPGSQPGPAARLSRPLRPSGRRTHPEEEGLQVFSVSPLPQDAVQGLNVPGATLLVPPGDKTCRRRPNSVTQQRGTLDGRVCRPQPDPHCGSRSGGKGGPIPVAP